MKIHKIVSLAFFIGLLPSCKEREHSSSSIDLGGNQKEFSLTRDGKKFIDVTQYMNGCRVKLLATDGSEVVIALNQNSGTVEEVFVIKSVIDAAKGISVKKFISINEKCEVEIVEK